MRCVFRMGSLKVDDLGDRGRCRPSVMERVVDYQNRAVSGPKIYASGVSPGRADRRGHPFPATTHCPVIPPSC